MNEGPPVGEAKIAGRSLMAARDGFVAGAYFARWHREQDMRTMVKVLLSHPQPKPVRDFFDGFISGVEAEQHRQQDLVPDELPFIVDWSATPDIGWGETEWVIGPQPGPWQLRRPGAQGAARRSD